MYIYIYIYIYIYFCFLFLSVDLYRCSLSAVKPALRKRAQASQHDPSPHASCPYLSDNALTSKPKLSNQRRWLWGARRGLFGGNYRSKFTL